MADTREVEVELATDDDHPVKLYVEARRAEGEAEVGFDVVEGLRDVTDAIRVLATDVSGALKAAAPDRFTVEMGFEMKLESTGLVAMLVRGGGTAAINVTLEWEKDSKAPASPGG